ncbi:MAG: hypothetical protein QOK15_3694 [Nocardioidaceae bacterium]|nr:hypothetical protein [Nocardioidaceae bacterium]
MPSDHPDASRPDDSEPGLDIDAAFAEIVAHWEPSPPSTDDDEPVERTVSWDSGLPAPEEPDRRAPDPAPRPAVPVDDEEEHYVPPPPPPLPKLDPRRKLAWIGVFGAPVLGLVLMVLGVVVPGWADLGLVVAFVGGFGYLVATMGSSPPDPWSGDDGAVL